MGKAQRPLLLVMSLSCLGCLTSGVSPFESLPVHPLFLGGDTVAAQSQVDSLSMEARIAQLMMVPLYSKPEEPESVNEVAKLISEFGIGGVIAMQGDKATTRRNLFILDSLAKITSGIGLLTAIDAEWGSGMRLADGIRFPKAMVLGAIQDIELIRHAARVTGYELRSLHVDMDFSPVVDVNSNHT